MIEFISDYRGVLTNEQFFTAGQQIDPAQYGLTSKQVGALIADGRAQNVPAEDTAPPEKPKGKGKK